MFLNADGRSTEIVSPMPLQCRGADVPRKPPHAQCMAASSGARTGRPAGDMTRRDGEAARMRVGDATS